MDPMETSRMTPQIPPVPEGFAATDEPRRPEVWVMVVGVILLVLALGGCLFLLQERQRHESIIMAPGPYVGTHAPAASGTLAGFLAPGDNRVIIQGA